MSIKFILDRPSHPGNVIAAARNTMVMGFPELRVAKCCPMQRIRYRLDSDEKHILDCISLYQDLDAALADCTFVVGTTARLGGWRQECTTIREAAPWILNESKLNEVGILFGCEKWGLDNDIICQCDLIMTVPVTKDQKSLNLAQAILLVGYELLTNPIDQLSMPVRRSPFPLVSEFSSALRELLDSLHYFKRGIPEYWHAKIMRPLARAGLTEADVALFMKLIEGLRLKVRKDLDEES